MDIITPDYENALEAIEAPTASTPDQEQASLDPNELNNFRMAMGRKIGHIKDLGFLNVSALIGRVQEPKVEKLGPFTTEDAKRWKQEELPYFHLSSTQVREEKTIKEHFFIGIWLDYDEGNPEIEDIKTKLKTLGLGCYAIWSTLKHQKINSKTGESYGNRYRVVVLFKTGVNWKTYLQFAHYLFFCFGGEDAGLDKKSTVLSQAIFLPVKADKYEYHFSNDDELDTTDTSHPFVAGAMAYEVPEKDYKKANKKTTQIDHLKASVTPRPTHTPAQANGFKGPIDWFNQKTIEWVLEQCGFDQDDDSGKWRPPDCGSPHGVSIENNRAYFHHANHPLCDEMAHSPFDVWVAYRHGGDDQAALAEIRDIWQPVKGIELVPMVINGELVNGKAVDTASDKARSGRVATKAVEQEQPAWKPYTTISGSALMQTAKPPQWLIKGWIPEKEMGLLLGGTQSFKSFIMLHLAYCISTGNKFGDYPVERMGKVLFVIGEGSQGFTKRVRALMLRHGETDDIHLLEATPCLSRLEDMGKLKATINQVQPVLVVVDTFSSLSGIKDENSNSQVSDVYRQVRALTDEAIIVVHHLGKDASKGGRGAGAFKNNVDFEWLLTRDGMGMNTKLVCDKAKDDELSSELLITMDKQHLHIEDDENKSASLVVGEIKANTSVKGTSFTVNPASILIAVKDIHYSRKQGGSNFIKHHQRKVLLIPRKDIKDWLSDNGYAKLIEEGDKKGKWSGKDNTAFSRGIEKLQSSGDIGITDKGGNGVGKSSNIFLYEKKVKITV